MIYFNILDLYAEKGSVIIKWIFDGSTQNTKHKLKLSLEFEVGCKKSLEKDHVYNIISKTSKIRQYKLCMKDVIISESDILD